MPYITQKARQEIRDGRQAASAGELNFVLAEIVDKYIEIFGLRYATLNEVVGVLECLKLEVYRRLAVPYEDVKKLENGDVFESRSMLPPGDI